LSVALLQTQDPEYKAYQVQVLKNCKIMENEFRNLGYEMVSGGTDTHLLLLDLSKKGTDGARVERILELCNVATNKNTIPRDTSALVPHGLRIGSPAMTTRGFKEREFKQVVSFIDEAIKLSIELSKVIPGKKFSDFKAGVDEKNPSIQSLKSRVIKLAESFPLVV
jgi:glycine hydroxymethyltransferase